MKPDTGNPLLDLPIIVLGIGICVWMLSYIFVEYPATCAKLECMSHGAYTCGLGPGLYIFGFAIVLSLVVFGYLLYSALMRSLE